MSLHSRICNEFFYPTFEPVHTKKAHVPKRFRTDDVRSTSHHVRPLTCTERIVSGYLRTQLNSVISLQPNSSSIKRGLRGDIRVSSTLRQSGAHLKTSIAAAVVTPATHTPLGRVFYPVSLRAREAHFYGPYTHLNLHHECLRLKLCCLWLLP